MSQYDAILIPGGGVREGGELPIWVQRRLDRSLDIQQGEYIITLSAGTTHKPPPLDDKGFPIFEAIGAANYLVKRGWDPKKILTETSSYDTIGNAYFSRVIHIEPRGWRKLLIITSEFHLARTKSIFQWVYGLGVPANYYQLQFESVTDAGIEQEALEARREKERQSLVRLAEIQSQVQSFPQLHEWLFTEHGAYSVSVRPQQVKDSKLEMY
ncbi:MAG: YdcF family protein [Hormoscilla sp.]